MTKRVAINGFGRIGRAAARIILDRDDLELVAINDPSPAEQTKHLFMFDSNFGRFNGSVELEDNGNILNINGQKIRNISTRNIEELPWKELNIDIVLECTGVFRTKEQASKHIESGAKKVLLSAPAKSEGFKTIVLGVNDEELKDSDVLVSNASCTTNCLAPVVKIIDENFGIISGLMTTIHSYTNDQRVLDVGHKDLRRARAAAQNIIPTSTGAARSVGLVYPKLVGKLNGTSMRVPTQTVSIVDFVAKIEKTATAEEINEVLKKASKVNPNIIGFETRPLVSSDYIGDERSTIIDADQTMVMDDMVKILTWYDNEWGYSCRLVDLAAKM